jgi:hypothetical protein
MRGNPSPYHAEHYALPLGFNGRWAWLYRWFSGRPMNGHRYTDAGGFRRATTALDVSGRATAYQRLPGVLRFLYVRVPLMLSIPLAVATLVWPLAMYLFGLGLVLVATWPVDRWRKVRAFRKDVTEPVAAGAAAVLRAKRVDGQGHTWVSVPRGFRDDEDATIRMALPLDWLGTPADKAALVDMVAAKLNLEELMPMWSLHGGQPSVTFSVPPKPPAMATWLDARAEAEATEDTAPMIGYGPRRRVEVFSLALESPHMLIAGGSGAGKSVFLAWLIAQFMRRGFGVLVLDAKFVSHQWLRRVPGVAYASEAQEMHDALVWLDAEMMDRARKVSSAADTDAAAAALVPIVAVLEEINSATNRLRAYWKSIKGPEDPQMSPALTALANLASMGRELRVHILMAGQSLTAKSVGGPEGRENFGGRSLARATAAQWRMLAPQIKPAPVKRGRPGRWHMVVGDTLREFQVPFIDLKADAGALIEWATSGRPVPDVAAMIEAWEPEGGATTGETEVPRSEVVTPAGISLRQYADEAGLSLPTLRKWSDRQDFPVEAGIGANRTRLYDRDHLKDYVRSRLREPVSAEEVDG